MGHTPQQQTGQRGIGLHQHGRIPKFFQQQISGMDAQAEQVDVDNCRLGRYHGRVRMVIKGNQ